MPFDMMDKTQPDIQIAACGVQHPSRHAEFYPDDLPEDWRLTFYSNEFRALVVPAHEWIAANTDEVQRWLEETREDFIFYLEVADLQTDWSTFADKARLLGPQLGGIVLRPVQWDADLVLLSATLEKASAIAPLSLFLPESQTLAIKVRALLAKYGVELAWQLSEIQKEGKEVEPATLPWRGDGALMVVWIDGDLTYSPRQWREIIETALHGITYAKPDKRVVLLMFDGDSPDFKSMRTAAMIGDMLEQSGSQQQSKTHD